jgi:NADP-dependent 3-hydroxy acid dehydrogenase YdfG
MNTDIKNKIAVVSGATGYVGGAVAMELTKHGIDIIGLSRLDLADMQSLEKALKKIENEKGLIDICVHAAWPKPQRQSLLKSSITDAKTQFDAIDMSFNLISACARRFKEQKRGVIVGITTDAIFSPIQSKNLGAYTIAKNALQNILAAFREELISSNVSVYSVAPGFMAGGMNADIPKAFIDMEREKTPGKKLLDAQDVAVVVADLCTGKRISDLTIRMNHAL